MMTAIWGQWSRFWFTPRPGSVMTLMRVMIGLTVVASGLSILPDLGAFHLDGRAVPDPSYATHRLALFRWVDGDGVFWVTYVAMFAAGLALIVGRAVRVAAPLAWYTVLSIQLGSPLILNAGDQFLRLWVAWFALFALLTPRRHLEQPLFGVVGADGRRAHPLAPGWFVRLAQIQLTVIYPATAIAKLDGSTWREGTAALYALGLRDFARFPVPDVIEGSLVAGAVMTWGTLAIELALPVLLWVPRTRRIGIVLGLALHAGFSYAMRLGFFGWVMAIAYVAFLTPAEASRLLEGVRRLFARGRIGPDRTPSPTPAHPL